MDVTLGVARSSARVGSGKMRLVKLHARSLPQLNCAGVRDDGSGETSKSSKLHQYPKSGRSTEMNTSANVLPRIRCERDRALPAFGPRLRQEYRRTCMAKRCLTSWLFVVFALGRAVGHSELAPE